MLILIMLILTYLGFAKKVGDRSVKLHATLMNTRLRNEGETPTPNEGGPGNNRGRQSMNAKPLLEVGL